MRRLIGTGVAALLLVGCAQHPRASSRLPAPQPSSQPSGSATAPVTPADTVSPAAPRTTAVAVAGAIPWIDAPAPAYAPPTPLPAKPLPRSSPACSAAQVTVRNLGSSGRTQDRGSVLQFTNASRRTCLLLGRPRITLRGPGFGPAPLTQFTDEEPGTSDDMPPGQSTWLWLNARTNCLSGPGTKAPVVDRLDIALRGGGEVRLTGQAIPRSCGGIAESSFRRDLPEPKYPPVPLAGATMFLDVPTGAVHAGAVLSYTVLIRNPTSRPITMLPCPAYTQWFNVGSPPTGSDLQLNCQGHTALPAKATLAFSMRVTVPPDAPTGPATLAWSYRDAPFKQGTATRQVTIAGNDIPCQARQLRAAAPDPAVAFAGSGIYEVKDSGTALTVVVTNTSASPCTLQGAPTVAATGKDGSWLRLRFGETGFNGYQPPPPRTRLAPGAQARTVLSWHAKWCGGDADPVTVTLGLPAGGGEVTVTPAHGWTPPRCLGWDFPYNVSSTDFGYSPG